MFLRYFLQTQNFGVTLLVKDLKSKGESKFAFKRTLTMKKAGVDIENDDMLMNYMHEDGNKPWRGAHKKDPRFFTLLLEATSNEGNVIVDCTASTS